MKKIVAEQAVDISMLRDLERGKYGEPGAPARCRLLSAPPSPGIGVSGLPLLGQHRSTGRYRPLRRCGRTR
ncbi:MAG: hypothetical protein ACREON_00420 [Gemmatimonadaceae bacterium]